MAFDAASDKLVLAGGLKNPSEELERGQASSLSVWKMKTAASPCELLDYTMVVGNTRAMDDTPRTGEDTTTLPTDAASEKDHPGSGVVTATATA